MLSPKYAEIIRNLITKENLFKLRDANRYDGVSNPDITVANIQNYV